MAIVKLLWSSGFLRRGHVLQAGSGWRGKHCILYHSSHDPDSHGLPNGAGLHYEDCILLRSKKAAGPVQRGLDQPNGD